MKYLFFGLDAAFIQAGKVLLTKNIFIETLWKPLLPSVGPTARVSPERGSVQALRDQVLRTCKPVSKELFPCGKGSFFPLRIT
jgi:hypothetical protein